MRLTMKDGRTIATGRVTKKGIEKRSVGSSHEKASFSIDCGSSKDELGNWQHDYLECMAWDKDIDNIPELCPQDRVIVTGKLERREYEDKNGETRVSTECRVDFVMVNISATLEGSIPKPTAPTAPVQVEFSEFDESDDDLPF